MRIFCLKFAEAYEFGTSSFTRLNSAISIVEHFILTNGVTISGAIFQI